MREYEADEFAYPTSFFSESVQQSAPTFGFGVALEALESGKRVCRQGWNGKGMWLCLIQSQDYNIHGNVNVLGLIKLPFILMKTAGNEVVPWLASQTDILAKDWMIVE
jgi:hypothetical protein